MIIKSFRRQLESVFSLAAYKATGLLLPCNCDFYQPKHISASGISFNIDIAHQLYSKYKMEDFKFSEKGVTPRNLAEETAIFAHESDHFQIEIDSFGNFLVSPTELYLQEMKKNLLASQKAHHWAITVKNNPFQAINNNIESVLFKIDDLTMSSLRMVKNLEIICRKKIQFKESSQQTLVKVIDVSELNEQEVQALLQLNLIDLSQAAIRFIVSSKIRSSFILKHSNIKLIQDIEVSSAKDWLSACLRHKTIQFSANYSTFQDQNILKFGQIFPNLNLSQIKNSYSASYASQVNKILRYSLAFDHKLPINIRQSTSLPQFPSSCLPVLLQNRRPIQQILILLDSLGNNQIIHCYFYLRSKQLQSLNAQDKEIFSKISSALDKILD